MIRVRPTLTDPTETDSMISSETPAGRTLATLTTIAALVALALAVTSPAAHADFEFGVGTFEGGAFNADGSTASQALSHPYSVSATVEMTHEGFFNPGEQLKNVDVELPPGFIGNPAITPTLCTPEQLFQGQGNECPVSSQVGVAEPLCTGGPCLGGARPGIYNMVPITGTPATFGFVIGKAPAFLVPELRTGDYGLTVRASRVPTLIDVTGSKVTLWGVPADPSHDADRGTLPSYDPDGPGGPQPPTDPKPVKNCSDPDDPFNPAEDAACTNPAGYEPVPFITLPGNCSAGAVRTTLRAESWQDPGEFETAFFDHDTNGNPTAVTGCEEVPFTPQISIRPTSTRPDAPTGLDVELSMPTDGLLNPDGLAQAHLKRVQVTLPEGMTINPSSADGLQGCPDAQLGIDNAGAAHCPEASKVGTVSIETPLLDEPLDGGVYVRSQASSDPASGDMFRIAIVVDSEELGVRIKLAGRVAADPATGRLSTTFDDNPQIPFSKLSLSLKGGARAPLANPPTCGTKTVTSELSSWSAIDLDNPLPSEIVERSSSFAIECPGQAGFAPAFAAGSVSPTGGAFSPFVARIDRPDGQQPLAGVSLDMPKGLIAKLRGVQLCPDAVAGDGTPGACPAGSRIGTATVGAGVGPTPFFLKGDVFLTGPYKGGPYGLSVAVHAKAGPFDLGMVKVRQAIHVDPETAEISVVSDPLPQIVKGVPVRLRSVNVDADRAGFTINPTSCSEKRIDATLTSTQGSVSKASSRFQAADCVSLAFKPRLAMRLTGRKQRRTGGHPGLRVTLRQAGGQANLKGLAVKLPRSLALDPDNAQGLCSFEEARKADPKCPESSIVGRATAHTPVLDKPLSGPVYFAENKRVNKFGRQVSTLPSLVIALRGEVAINVRQSSDVRGGRLVSTTSTIPDAPVSRFDLRLEGGDGGILTVTRTERRRFDVCKGRHTALVESDGQNGKRADFPVRVKAPCKPKRRT